MDKKDEVIRIVNKMIESCEPIKYEYFNKAIREKEKGILEKIESEDNVVGISQVNEKDSYCITTLSLIATITDILIGERLAFKLDGNGCLIGVDWYKTN